MSHEGHFPGRKRIVFRPRFENEYGETFRSASAAHSSTALFHEHAAKQRKEKRKIQKAQELENDSKFEVSEANKVSADPVDGKVDSEVYSDDDGDEDAEDSSRLAAASAVSTSAKNRSIDENVDASDPNSDLRTVRALAVACAGYIKDVADPSPSQPSSFPSSASLTSLNAGDSTNPALDPSEGQGNQNQVHVPGSGWGLVDADDGEEGGFGVVGLANPTDLSPATSSAASNPVEDMLAGQASDMMGDLRQLEDNFKHGRNYTDTGPCHSGTRYIFLPLQLNISSC